MMRFIATPRCLIKAAVQMLKLFINPSRYVSWHTFRFLPYVLLQSCHSLRIFGVESFFKLLKVFAEGLVDWVECGKIGPKELSKS